MEATMKFFLIFLISAFNAYSQDAKIAIHEITRLDFKDGISYVFFNNEPFSKKIHENDKVMPCLKNAFFAHQKVLLKVENNKIVDCKLYVGGIPYRESDRTQKKEAQEEPKK